MVRGSLSGLSKEDVMFRMHSFASTGLTLGLLLLSTTWAAAQDRKDVRTSVQVRKVSTIIGGTVVLKDNVSVGKIEDIVINEDGCVDFLVVAYQEKFLVVPWTVGRFDFERRTIAVEITKERFQEVPTFTREKWPDFSDTKFIETVHKSWGVQPGKRPRPEERREEKRKPPE
jgi:hypothetical protein